MKNEFRKTKKKISEMTKKIDDYGKDCLVKFSFSNFPDLSI